MTDAIQTWRSFRQRCRTDLHFFCTECLDYKDVTPEVHLELLGVLQRFPGGEDTAEKPNLRDMGYKPAVPLTELKGKRKKLILMSRGFLKTSIVTVGHVAQWMINYPDIRILLVSAKLQRAQEYLDVIKQHFIKNEKFRAAFPEYCPQPGAKGKLPDFGNQDEFTLPCRKAILKEPTLRVASAESVVAGGHYDIIIADDMVEEQYCRTPEGIEYIKKFFGLLDPVVENYNNGTKGWTYLIGTLYHHNDLHNVIFETESSKPKEQRVWQVFKQSAAPNYPDGPVSWPARFPLEALKRIERDPALGSQMLYNQYLLKIVNDGDGLLKDKSAIRWISKKDLDPLLARLSLYVTIDLAGMEPATKGDPDYTVINLHGWGTDGRCYFLKIFHGRPSPDEVIDRMFWLFSTYPQIRSFKMEKEAHARVLLPFLRKQFTKRGFLPIDAFPRDNKMSKQQKIKGTQPYWKEKCFVFSEDLDDTPEKSAQTRLFLEKEVLYFPKFNHDDILDTICDSLLTREGRVMSAVEGREKTYEDDSSYLQEGAVREWKGVPVENITHAEFFRTESENSRLVDDWTGM